jgi:hypothetical protein
MRKTLTCVLASGTLALAAATSVEARSNFDIYIGTPFYGGYYGGIYEPDLGIGYYDGYRYPPRRWRHRYHDSYGFYEPRWRDRPHKYYKYKKKKRLRHQG